MDLIKIVEKQIARITDEIETYPHSPELECSREMLIHFVNLHTDLTRLGYERKKSQTAQCEVDVQRVREIVQEEIRLAQERRDKEFAKVLHFAAVSGFIKADNPMTGYDPDNDGDNDGHFESTENFVRNRFGLDSLETEAAAATTTPEGKFFGKYRSSEDIDNCGD